MQKTSIHRADLPMKVAFSQTDKIFHNEKTDEIRHHKKKPIACPPPSPKNEQKPRGKPTENPGLTEPRRIEDFAQGCGRRIP